MRLLQSVLGYLDICPGAPGTVSTNRGERRPAQSWLSLCSHQAQKGRRRARVHCLVVCGGAGAFGEKAAKVRAPQ